MSSPKNFRESDHLQQIKAAKFTPEKCHSCINSFSNLHPLHPKIFLPMEKWNFLEIGGVGKGDEHAYRPAMFDCSGIPSFLHLAFALLCCVRMLMVLSCL